MLGLTHEGQAVHWSGNRAVLLTSFENDDQGGTKAFVILMPQSIVGGGSDGTLLSINSDEALNANLVTKLESLSSLDNLNGRFRVLDPDIGQGHIKNVSHLELDIQFGLGLQLGQSSGDLGAGTVSKTLALGGTRVSILLGSDAARDEDIQTSTQEEKLIQGATAHDRLQIGHGFDFVDAC